MNSSTSSRNDGGPAFPADSFAAQHCPGMSLRAWLTGQALAGLCANATLLDHLNEGDSVDNEAFALSVASGAKAMADAALKLLERS